MKGLLRKETAPHNSHSGTNGQNLRGIPLSSFIFGRVAGWRPTYKFNRRNSLLLSCLLYIKLYVGKSFFFRYLRFSFLFFCIYFGFDETKLTRGKLYGELGPVLKYNFKERGRTFRLRLQIWSIRICRLNFSTYWIMLAMTKTGYNIQSSKSWLALT